MNFVALVVLIQVFTIHGNGISQSSENSDFKNIGNITIKNQLQDQNFTTDTITKLSVSLIYGRLHLSILSIYF